MQITETVSEGLRREYKIVVPQGDLDAKVTARLEEMKPKMHLKGFRPGKAPVSFLKKQFGKSMMGEVVEQVVNDGSAKAIADNSLKPAFAPRVEPMGELEQVMDGKADLEFTVTVDLMPDFDLTDVSKIKIDRLTADVTDADIDEALKRLAEQSRTYSSRPAGEAAQLDDQVVIDFVGSLDGVEFAGGTADDFNLTLGSGQFIPGFEEQLVGVKAGEKRDVNVKFPEEYGEPKLAGKDALFVVTVKDVKAPDEAKVDDELAKRMGLQTVGELKERVREQVKTDFTRASRVHLKRRILDALDSSHSFELPPAMVESEFNGIWNAVEQELKREGKTAADEGKTEEELKKEYHDIAERRIRLGLVLARIGEQNGLTVANDELQRAVAQRARQFPGQEQQVFEFYMKNQQALAEIRAPIFEDKVVDFVAELADVTDKKVDRETLFMDPDEALEKLKSK
ncbi:MAG TPA: trigger factor [Rhizomicrobium sp.]|nr:trigger factor [Rhizomicrobium sp.]